jgi:hypothetical protein
MYQIVIKKGRKIIETMNFDNSGQAMEEYTLLKSYMRGGEKTIELKILDPRS